jgi:hypothetical protein
LVLRAGGVSSTAHYDDFSSHTRLAMCTTVTVLKEWRTKSK